MKTTKILILFLGSSLFSLPPAKLLQTALIQKGSTDQLSYPVEIIQGRLHSRLPPKTSL